jgi:hypothetical protein
MNKKEEVFRKIAKLAQAAENGEKEAAQAALERLKEKYGFALSQLNVGDEVVEKREIKHGNGYRELFFSVIQGYFPHVEEFYKIGNKRSTTLVECTESEKIDIEVHFDFFKELYEEEKGVFEIAFRYKHKLYDPDKVVKGGERTEEQKRLSERVKNMSRALKDKRFQKRLEDDKTSS